MSRSMRAPIWVLSQILSSQNDFVAENPVSFREKRPRTANFCAGIFFESEPIMEHRSYIISHATKPVACSAYVNFADLWRICVGRNSENEHMVHKLFTFEGMPSSESWTGTAFDRRLGKIAHDTSFAKKTSLLSP